MSYERDLIYCGRKLRDDQTLDFYGIQSGSTVHVLRKSWPEPDQKPGEEEEEEKMLWVTPQVSSGCVWCGTLVTEEQLLL
ncbi:ubiquitin-like protein 7 [Limosa lapponica baueri]|uniref:Ubiquitin-like protein 7 n=1 Tax=Limosa lapponica baueri TaxID=1758121 RepID=A0A2I0T2E8_LIMLA|nr:ubiquitin-like protein 7 [Limosa lapponica baueri]